MKMGKSRSQLTGDLKKLLVPENCGMEPGK